MPIARQNCSEAGGCSSARLLDNVCIQLISQSPGRVFVYVFPGPTGPNCYCQSSKNDPFPVTIAFVRNRLSESTWAEMRPQGGPSERVEQLFGFCRSSSKRAETGPEAFGVVVCRFVGNVLGILGLALHQIRLELDDFRPDP